MPSLEKIKQQLQNGKQIEEIIAKIGWQDFERLVSKILEKHDFKTWNNFRFKTSRRYEVDIIAADNSTTFLIDCKQWSAGRYKSSALKKAIKDQEERLDEFQKFTKNNPIAKTEFRIKSNQKLASIIITWHEEEPIKHGQTLVVPVWKLNEFLLNKDGYT